MMQRQIDALNQIAPRSDADLKDISLQKLRAALGNARRALLPPPEVLVKVRRIRRTKQNAAYYAENADKVREWGGVYRTANAEKIKERKAAYCAENKEKVKARMAAWRTENKEKVKADRAAYYAANRDKALERVAAYLAANPEVRAAYRTANADKIREMKAAYRAENADKIKEREAAWRAANPDKMRAQEHTRRARKRGAEGKFTAEDISTIRAAQKDKCAMCKTKLKGRGHRDHIVPLAKGGSNWPANIQLLCGPCNCSKGAKDPIAFARTHGRLL
jgi:5-methylcytosine-specific restriction endonuclease McrA